jgi:hypothetical protein
MQVHPSHRVNTAEFIFNVKYCMVREIFLYFDGGARNRVWEPLVSVSRWSPYFVFADYVHIVCVSLAKCSSYTIR